MGDSELHKGRCPQDTDPRFGGLVQWDNFRFTADEVELAGINTVMSTMTTLAAIMCRGVKADYTTRVALGVLSRLLPAADKHLICPFSSVVDGITGILMDQATVVYDRTSDQFAIVWQGMRLLGEGNPPLSPSDPNDGGGICGEQVP